MTVLAEPVETAPLREAPARAPLAGFLTGVLFSQVVNSALHLAQPLLMIQLTGSMSKAAFFSSFDTAVHMLGSFLGGWPADKMGARRLLALSTFLRGASLAIIPALWLLDRLTLNAAMAAYTLDALVRGFVDTAAHALPLELGDGDRAELDRMNSRYELVFDLGGVAGPLILGGLMMGKKGLAPHLAVPVGFMLASVAFLAVPARRVLRAKPSAEPAKAGTIRGLKLVFSNPALLVAAFGVAGLNLFPLRKLLSAFFAKSILSQPHAAGWVGGAFGLGGALGTLWYARKGGTGDGSKWVVAGAAGVIALAVGWVPGALWPMLLAAFAFALTNVGARLALTRRLQENTPADAVGGVTAVSRFSANAVSVILKTAVGAAFALGASPRTAFAVVGVGLALVACGQLALAAHLKRTPIERA